jgi:hypothetical protein
MRTRAVWVWTVCVLAFLWLALDGALHWDEPAYLYTGGVLSLEQILSGDFQPSGIESFYLTRPLHILMIHAVTAMTGPGMQALAAVIAVCTSALVGFLVVTRLILRELMPGSTRLNTAFALGLLIPVVPYLAFKTLPENTALLCSATAMLALLKMAGAARWGGTLLWGVLAASAVALTLWLKGPMLLLPGSGVLAVVLCAGPAVRRARLIGSTVAAVIAGIVLAYAGVVLIGIDPSIYTTGILRAGVEHEPIAARILNNGVEPGVFLLALPLAFLSPRKREAAVMAGWFLLASVPLALLFPSMEARYLSPNVPALIGLTALALDGIAPRLDRLWQARRVPVMAGTAIVTASVVLGHALAISVMQHEVKIGQIHTTLSRLDDIYGRGSYAILTAWPYTDLHYLAFVYPGLPVYSVHRVETIGGDRQSQELMRSSQERYYPQRLVLNPGQMDRLGGRTPVLFGFHENFAIANLRTIFAYVPGDHLARALDDLYLYDHLTTAWLWDNPGYDLIEVVQVGHYRAFEVRPVGEAVMDDPGDQALSWLVLTPWSGPWKGAVTP